MDPQTRATSSENGAPEQHARSHWAAAVAAAAVVGLTDPRPLVAVDLEPQARPAISYSVIPPRDSAELAWWRESMQSHDQRMQWFRQARFGMFVHWGVYSDLAGTWQGKPVQGYAEHVMRKAKIPIDVYTKEVAAKFNPTRFDADAWARLAKDAGMGYMVITAKHHDGFAMYDSDVDGGYNVVDATAWKHDPMRDLKRACAARGIRFGFYYSQAWDWGHPDGTGNDWDFDHPAGDRGLHGAAGKNWWDVSPHLVAKVAKYVDGKAIPQLRELIEKYEPDILWFDTPHKMPPSENYRVFRATREAGKNVVINSRCVEQLADYQSTADRPAELPPHDGDWEAIPTTNESYGYHRADRSHKPVAHFIEILAKTAARGGNVMLNVGPRGDGTIDESDVAILAGIGKWMRANGESIHGTTRTPLPVQAWGESTRKGSTIYLHVFDWPADGRLVVGGLKSTVTRARLLADPSGAALKVTRLNACDLEVEVPQPPPDETDSVVALELEGAGEPVVDGARLLSPTQDNVLRVFDGRLNGATIRFGQGKRENAYVEQWTRPSDSVSWTVRCSATATWQLGASYDAPEGSVGGGAFEVVAGLNKLPGIIQPGRERFQPLGTLTLEAGEHEVRVQPAQITGEELMRLRHLTLTAVRHATSGR